jgi:hypothetical protein
VFKFTDGPEPYNPAHIITNLGRVAEMIRRSEEVLHGFRLKYFERSSELVNTSYARDTAQVKDIERAKDSVIIIPASHETIVRDLDSRANYVSVVETPMGQMEKVVHVPGNLPDQIHDRVRSNPREVPYPSLDMVTGSPVLLPSGDVHRGGSFQESVLFVNLDFRRYAVVPDRPTKRDAEIAMMQFEPIFKCFPFVDPPGKTVEWNKTASYSVVLASIFSLVARPHLGLGAIPLFGATAPTRRSGKTKIFECACMAALGHRPTAAHFTDEEEMGKHLQPLMRVGDRAILLDNVERSLQSSKLCILITGGVMRDRVLGESRDVILKNYSVIFCTGNNLVIGGDLSARAVRTDIDPVMERPEDRKFSFDPVSLAAERHPQLVVAALTALRAYLLAGSPWTKDSEEGGKKVVKVVTRGAWGGFEAWDRLVSGCLMWLGFADPYEARERIMDADPIRSANVDILEEWYARYKDRVISLREIRNDEKGEVYKALLKDNRWDGHFAQWILRRLEGQSCGGLRLVRQAGQSRYKVQKMEKAPQSSFPYKAGVVTEPTEPF